MSGGTSAALHKERGAMRCEAGGLLIINADDWGGWQSATDAALACYENGRITSASAMVFMEDSRRAALLAKSVGIDTGLHVNFNQKLTDPDCPEVLMKAHESVRRFLRCSKYAQLIYNPWIQKQFTMIYGAQRDEYVKLYDREPSHIDGHQHMHLCANALFGEIFPGGAMVRRSFSFWAGEKSILNRYFRFRVYKKLRRRYKTTDYFFSLAQCLAYKRLERVAAMAKSHVVELMSHPEIAIERNYLMSESWSHQFGSCRLGNFKEVSLIRETQA
jgi:predicted glycoside hydrolase/deacetylase ChbG (UPF0249 family)